MSNLPRITFRTCRFVKQSGRWYQVINGTTLIDERNQGHASKAAVKRWAKDRELYCGESIDVRFQ